MIQRVEPGRHLLQRVTSCHAAQRAAQGLVERRLTVGSTPKGLEVLETEKVSDQTDVRRNSLIV